MTPTDICNMALAFLAKGRIASMDENTEQARQCKLFYEVTKKDLLRNYTWGFAKKIDKLAELTPTEKNPYWVYIYTYPQKCVAVRKIFDQKTGRKVLAGQQKEWDLFMASENVLAVGCNIRRAYLEYTYDGDDTNLFSADFIDAFSHMLAFNICIQLTGNSGLQQTQYQLAQAALMRAKYTTVQEKHNIPDYPTRYFDGRR